MMLPHDESDDVKDIRLSLNGEREAFGRLYDRYARGVRSVVIAVSGDFSSVEDLTQETFLRGYRRLNSLKKASDFRQWIQGIARFVAKERLKELSRDRNYFAIGNHRTIRQENSPDKIELLDEQKRIFTAIKNLPERERLAIHAYYFQEQNAEQASRDLGISKSGYYAALERAMDRLRQQLGVRL